MQIKYRVQSTCAFVFFSLKEEASSFDENEVMKSGVRGRVRTGGSAGTVGVQSLDADLLGLGGQVASSLKSQFPHN